MARTKAEAQRKKTLGKSIPGQSNLGTLDEIKKKRRWKPGTVALRDIRHYQRSTKTLIPKLSFRRLVQEVLQEYGHTQDITRLSKKAVEALQEGGEQFISSLYNLTNTLAIHSNRVTIRTGDLKLAAALLNGDGSFAEGMSLSR